MISALLCGAVTGFGQNTAKPAAPEESYVRTHYTNYEYRIPIRDGKHLFTPVYVPKDTSQSYPILIDRTPYSVSPYGVDHLRSPYNTYYAIKRNNSGTPNTLVEGPWLHGGWSRGDEDQLGDAQFSVQTTQFFRTHIQFPFFKYGLKGKGSAMPAVYVFETGTNVWRTYDQWPPSQAQHRMLYFHRGGKLSFDLPTEDEAHPVPFVEYTLQGVPQRYVVDDQRWAARRPDVLAYQTDPLEEDVTIAGPISPKLKVATSGTDSDFVVKLFDVYPEDYPDDSKVNETRRSLGGIAAGFGHGRLSAARARRTHASQVSR